jgi:hypothetical protein
LTNKTTPTGSDLVLIQDQAASGALKYSTLTQVIGAVASGVSSFNTRTGAVVGLADDVPWRGYLSGLTLSAAGSTATYGIAAGTASDSTAVSAMRLASAYTKTASAWAVGTANGSLDTGTIAINTWYHVHLIQRPDTGIVDVLVSLSPTAPTLPTNYTLFRRIGSMKTDGSGNWMGFTQVGDEFLWLVAKGDINTTFGTSVTNQTLASVPTGVRVNALGIAGMLNAATASILMFSPDQTATTVINTPAGNYNVVGGAGGLAVNVQMNLRTNTSAQVGVVAGVASTQLFFVTNGWIDTRGRI